MVPSGFDVAWEVLRQVAADLKERGSALSALSHSPRQEVRPCPRDSGGPLMVTWVCQRMPGPELMAAINWAVADRGEGGGSRMIVALFVQSPQVRFDIPPPSRG